MSGAINPTRRVPFASPSAYAPTSTPSNSSSTYSTHVASSFNASQKLEHRLSISPSFSISVRCFASLSAAPFLSNSRIKCSLARLASSSGASFVPTARIASYTSLLANVPSNIIFSASFALVLRSRTSRSRCVIAGSVARADASLARPNARSVVPKTSSQDVPSAASSSARA